MIELSQAEKNVLRAQNDRLSNDEFEAFLDAASRYSLNPMANQIYAQVRGQGDRRRVTYVTGIDGYRLIADRTKAYAGNDDPVFDDEKQVSKASVTVYKLVGGVRCPFTATARWDQYYPGDQLGFMWKRMPHLMIGKCAEALALRKAFPAEFIGLYTAEEMQQADNAEAISGRIPFDPEKMKERPKTDDVKPEPTKPQATAPEVVSHEPQTMDIHLLACKTVKGVTYMQFKDATDIGETKDEDVAREAAMCQGRDVTITYSAYHKDSNKDRLVYHVDKIEAKPLESEADNGN
jgi:phage recombination protein Bet